MAAGLEVRNLKRRSKMAKIHVVGFAPKKKMEGGPGGFEWRENLQEVKKLARKLRDGKTDIKVVTVNVPLDIFDAGKETVTDWLDHNPDLWDPPYGSSLLPG
jgi:hypothetical protein